jgi:Ser/Thr protein kinase RdoA (MazF antagonist)
MSVLKHAPQFSSGEAIEIVKSVYGFDVSAESLPSERDQNFVLVTENGKRLVLKIANALESRELLEAQNAALLHLKSRSVKCPQVLASRSGALVAEVFSTTGASHFIRLVTYLQGVPFAQVKSSAPLLFELGRFLGKLTRALADFDATAFHRDFHWDLANGANVLDEYKALVEPCSLREQLDQCTVNIKREKLKSLPCSVIHGDANDYNIIVGEDGDVGVIDFGDMIHSYTAGELAVALAYVVLDESDPLEVATEVVKGYSSEWRLNDDEIESIWCLMLMRLCMSVCLAAHQQQQQPDNAYLDISQRSIRDSLPRLLAIDAQKASTTFRRVSKNE